MIATLEFTYRGFNDRSAQQLIEHNLFPCRTARKASRQYCDTLAVGGNSPCPISEDIVRFKLDKKKKGDKRDTISLYWGEEVELLETVSGRTRLRVFGRGTKAILGSVKGVPPTSQKPPLKFMFADVQQGDGMIIVTLGSIADVTLGA